MKIAAAVLTYNPIRHGREKMLVATIHSLKAANVDVYLVDNGSTDGFAKRAEKAGGVVNRSGLTTSGHGTNLCARVLAATDADICVLSDDDISWRPGWATQLREWWHHAPDDIWLTGCHLEPQYPWNEIHDVVEVGKGKRAIKGLIRNSTGAATWSFRRRDYERIFPIPQQVQGWGDVPACERIWEHGGRVAQIGIADHAGHGMSTWGNQTNVKYGHDMAPVEELVAS